MTDGSFHKSWLESNAFLEERPTSKLIDAIGQSWRWLTSLSEQGVLL